jgi:DNA-binding transcriptional ArsR family regulator
MEEARHAAERGAILLALKQGYDQEMVSVGSLSRALNMVASPMTAEGLQFSLSLLADSEYIKIWRAKAMGQWRADRLNEVKPDTIMFARLLPRGLRLIDGQIEADPLVTF